MHRVRRTRLSAVVALGLLAVGCGSGSGSSDRATTHAGGATGAGATVRIVMKSLDFSPLRVRAKVGDTAVWTNEDTSPHNVTYVSGPRFNSSQTMNPGAKFSLRLTKPGTIHYYCSIHPWMKATIAVSR